MLVSLAFFTATGRMLGLAVSLPVLTATWVMVGALAVLTAALVRRRIGPRWIQLASAAVLWTPMAATALALHASGDRIFTLFAIVEIACAGVLLDTPLVVVTLVGMLAATIPGVAATAGAHTGVVVAALVTAASFALMIHQVMRRAVVDAQLRLAELERAQIESARLQEQLLHAQRMEAVGTLAAGLAHDMNNVLASITSFAELVDDTDHGTEIAQILKQAERGAALTRGLLAFSRRGQYRKQVIRLDQVVREVVPLLERMLPKSIELRCQVALAGACVRADAMHLGQAVVNLGVNAADAIDGKGTITIAAELAAGRARLRVTDTGRGMDAATRIRVFEPFFTTKAQGRGTGLGLATVWGIVQAHDGTITCESELGRGTTFTIDLPLTAGEPAPATVRELTGPLPTRTRVLVVDDEPAVLEATRRWLVRMGLDPVTACNGDVALRRFVEPPGDIELVILDMGMPVMGGAECFRAMRQHRDVPVLIATGYADDAEAQALVAAGAEIIEKPFPAAELERHVVRLLRRAPARRATT